MADEKDKKPKGQQQGQKGKPEGKKAKPEQVEAAEEPSGKSARPKANNRATARMRDKYYNEVRPVLMKEFSLDNPMAAPKAKKSIAAFKVREGMPIGVMVTLRGDRMYEFFDRLVNIALPRVRDFRGVPTKSFDGR